ncbi:MAG: TraB/GumN family protein [Nitrosomonadales bacterium]|nr:TraB/GumN family protein [Nitrosomonadales bacterium]
MRNPFRYALFVFLVLLPAFACAEALCPPASVDQPSPESMRELMSKAHDRGFLWRISKGGRTSYLYGTIHVAKPEWLFLGPGVMGALRAADTVALELDMADENIRQRISQGAAAMHGEVLPAQLALRLQHQAEAVCVPYASIASLIPEFQVTSLSAFVARWEGLDTSYAIDSVVGGIGHGIAKQVVSLETPELQLRMLQMSSRQKTLLFVEEGLDDLETGRARTMLRRSAQIWAETDYDGMARFGEWCECMDTELDREVMGRLLDERNPALSESIDALHTSGKQVFAAVGSLHMFGAMGLPALMEKRGYRVQRVDFDKR